ncbi:MAG: hypothetical protein GXX90_10600 [Microbacteriaceae bacterium]|nr:hypothetical protein [Microbacteriaceae bacterium]
MSTAPANVKALETGSGIAWDDWVEWLDSIGAAELDHAEMAKRVLARIVETGRSKSPEWWAQGVTVAYEQRIGRRQPGQRCDGSFSATASKTVAGDMDAVLARWSAEYDAVVELAGVPVEREPATSETEKWRYWRCGLADGSKVTVNIQTKPAGDRSSVAVNHDDLASPDDVDATRAYWRHELARFAAGE